MIIIISSAPSLSTITTFTGPVLEFSGKSKRGRKFFLAYPFEGSLSPYLGVYVNKHSVFSTHRPYGISIYYVKLVLILREAKVECPEYV
jgi:hypothetical protein